MKRRSFLRLTGCSVCASALMSSPLLPEVLGGLQNAYAFEGATELASVEARFYTKLDGGGIECGICPRHCRVTDLERGYCGTRENRDDTYYTLVYGLPCSLNIDPIEKKPLYHFYPGAAALSLATAGCNVNCKFCQNWEISQTRPEQTRNTRLSPQQAVDICRERSLPVIAYTYSEPVIFYEYMNDIAELGHRHGVKSVMITGGYIEKEPLEQLLPHLDAIKVDLKAIREDYYRDIVRGELKPVLERLVQMKQAGIWLELVYLVVPTLNDSDEEFHEVSRWVIDNLGADVPLHYSRFYPQYLLKHLPPTPAATLQRAYDISRAEGLQFVYLGNLRGHRSESTYCPHCGNMLIERRGYKTTIRGLSSGRCSQCGRDIPGVF